ncbi:MAG: hypothetical protein LBG92_09090 [Prevotellaceae bacterium]|jgi:hypothetical protein|nr:hypothetical protein [Prevotellaceae bacterium]
MKTSYKSIVALIAGLLLISCSRKEASFYGSQYAIVKQGQNSKYFLADEGLYLYPKGDVWDSKWGTDGDRVFVAFYYNPYSVSETSTGVYVDVSNVIPIPTQEQALPSSVDTVGTSNFLDYTSGSDKYSVNSWVVQNYLTSHFFIRYSDKNSYHNFGFIEEPSLHRHDTLFLRLWHNTTETGKNNVADALVSLKLDAYQDYLYADSTIISITYKAVNSIGSESEKTSYAVYKRRNDNPFGW